METGTAWVARLDLRTSYRGRVFGSDAPSGALTSDPIGTPRVAGSGRRRQQRIHRKVSWAFSYVGVNQSPPILLDLAEEESPLAPLRLPDW